VGYLADPSADPMPEQKYRFNPQTLNFERIRLSAWQKSKRVMLMLTPGLVVGLGHLPRLTSSWIARRRRCGARTKQLLLQYELLNKQLGEVDQVLGDVRRRDDNIYRVIFEADPLPEPACVRPVQAG
jgi:hypothetical protein